MGAGASSIGCVSQATIGQAQDPEPRSSSGEDEDEDAPRIVLASEEDEALALMLGAKSRPAELFATVLKAKIMFKRRLRATRPKYARTSSFGDAARRRVQVEVTAALRGDDIKTGMKLLSQRLQFCGLEHAEINGDGNCQFRSLSYQLFGSQRHHAHVRARACAHIRNHRAQYEVFFEPGELEHWVESMSELTRWGDELTLRAAADSFNAIIHVIQSTAENWHLIYTPARIARPVRRLVITYVAPIHYNSIVREFHFDDEDEAG